MSKQSVGFKAVWSQLSKNTKRANNIAGRHGDEGFVLKPLQPQWQWDLSTDVALKGEDFFSFGGAK